jgi:hypothetical protein
VTVALRAREGGDLVHSLRAARAEPGGPVPMRGG